MKLACISDTHGQEGALTVPDADVLVHCGDFSNLGSEAELRKFSEWLKRLPHQHVLVNPGNHDGMTFEDPHLAKSIIEGSRPGVRLLMHERLELGGFKWFFSPWTPEWAGWWWMLEAPEIAAKWAEIPDDTEILVTHGPPLGILDTVERDESVHCGCRALSDRVANLKQLRVHAFGHLHHSGGQKFEHNRCTFYNCAVLDDHNRMRQQIRGHVIEVEHDKT